MTFQPKWAKQAAENQSHIAGTNHADFQGSLQLRTADQNEYIARAFTSSQTSTNDCCFGSIGILGAEEHKTGADDDSQIEPNAPVFYIPKIVGDSLLHELQFGGLATEALDLCPTG